LPKNGVAANTVRLCNQTRTRALLSERVLAFRTAASRIFSLGDPDGTERGPVGERGREGEMPMHSSDLFEAFFEVAALSVALTISCIVGSRYAARCLRIGSPSNVSALLASLLTAFLGVYGERQQQQSSVSGENRKGKQICPHPAQTDQSISGSRDYVSTLQHGLYPLARKPEDFHAQGGTRTMSQ